MIGCDGSEHRAYLIAETHDMCLVESQDICLVETHGMCRVRARTCALFKANTKEAAFGRLHKGGRPSAAPLCGFLCAGSEHWAYLVVETQDSLVESQDIRPVETQDMCCVES